MGFGNLRRYLGSAGSGLAVHYKQMVCPKETVTERLCACIYFSIEILELRRESNGTNETFQAITRA